MTMRTRGRRVEHVPAPPSDEDEADMDADGDDAGSTGVCEHVLFDTQSGEGRRAEKILDWRFAVLRTLTRRYAGSTKETTKSVGFVLNCLTLSGRRKQGQASRALREMEGAVVSALRMAV